MIAFIDESTRPLNISIGVFIADLLEIDIIHRFLLDRYDKFLKTFGAKYTLAEAKFSATLNALRQKDIMLSKEEICGLLVEPIWRYIASRAYLRSLIIPPQKTFLSLFNDIYPTCCPPSGF